MPARRLLLALVLVTACGGGSGPKIALRYHPPTGAVYHYALSQRTAVTVKSGPLSGAGTQEMNVVMHFTQTVKGPASGGGTEVQVTFDSTTMDVPGMSSGAVAGELAKMRGMRSTVVFDERAQVLRSDFGQQPGVSPQMATQLGAGVKAMTFVFPEKPLAQGESWTVSAALPLGHLPGTDASKAGAAQTTLTLREIRIAGVDTTVVLDIRTRFPTGPIALSVGGSQATMKMSGELTGNQQFSISRGAVLDASLKGDITMNVTLPMFGSAPALMVSETENTMHLLNGK